jgi:hypothetical protein
MAQKENMGSFARENKDLIREYLETRYEIIRLKGIRSISKMAGSLAWVMIILLLGLLILIFGGLTMGYWLSAIFESNVAGFGVTTLFIILLLILLIMLRKQLFINPVMRIIINNSADDE